MLYVRFIGSLVLMGCVLGHTFAQKIATINDYFNSSSLRYEDYVYHDSIKTVLLYNAKSSLSFPIIDLNKPEHLQLSFDDLSNDFKTYQYTIIHCSANWIPSELDINEYIEGYVDDELTNFQQSFNTAIPYNNYQLTIPNEGMKITKSGNYLLVVYQKDVNNPVLTRRFLVVENKITFNASVRAATLVKDQFYAQEVDFSIDHTDYPITNPYQGFHVVLMQNHRWDNAIYGLKPRFVKNTVFDYNYNEENVFQGNNEYRNFDTKSLNYQSIEIERIEYNRTENITHVYLLDDDYRSYKKHYTVPDLNGNFLIRNDLANDSQTEAEYIKVHFSLPYPNPLTNGNLYLFGKFTDWQHKKLFQMEYDTLQRKYTKEVLLKQGYYNYQYSFVEDGNPNVGDLSVIEGTHYETENEYTILVYHRAPNDHYDRLIGMTTVSSLN